MNNGGSTPPRTTNQRKGRLLVYTLSYSVNAELSTRGRKPGGTLPWTAQTSPINRHLVGMVGANTAILT